MSDQIETYYVTPTAIHRVSEETKPKPHTRPYDFNLGDDRRVGFDGALSTARERSRISRKGQQVKLTEGPLLGQTQWLIQTHFGLDPRDVVGNL